MVKIRLMRLGAKKKPFYRVVIADAKARRNGPYIEIVGTYNPKTEPPEITLDIDRVKYWLQNGAQPTDTVRKLIERVSA
ncbi:30S ribosomal protein S16 [Thermodesulfovibrio hydrogeniphilus]